MGGEASGRGSVGWFLAGYAALAGFFALEAATRTRGSASSLDASVDDQGTTDAIATAYVISAVAAPFLRSIPLPRLPGSTAQFGLATEVAGLGVRAWSMRTLGRAYSRTLRTEHEQRVVEAGPYRYIRHPGYLGSNLIWLGFALSLGSPAVVALVGLLVGGCLPTADPGRGGAPASRAPRLRRLRSRTRRLIPFVW